MKKTDLYLKPGTYIRASTTQGEVQGTSLENFVVSVLNNPTCCPKPSFIKDGMLMTAAYLDTSLQTVTDQGPNSSPLKLSTLLVRVESALEIAERLRLEADSTVTTQTSSVIQATTTNANLVIAPNGTGALVASIPDGTATGGNARGTNAVDLQLNRNSAGQVANNYAVIVGGYRNIASGEESIVVGGSLNTANGYRSFIGGGNNNGASGVNSIIGGGNQNTASTQYSTVSGGQSNTASTNAHATVVGGQSNTSSGAHSVSGGNGNVASGFRSVALGGGSTVSGDRATSVGGSGNTVSGSLSGMLCGEDSTCAGSNNLCVGGKQTTVGNGTANSLVGGRSNAINNNVDYSFLGGGQSNIISGASGGADWSSIIGGFSNTATGLYSTVLGTKEANSFLYGSVASSSGMFSSVADAQQTSLTARREASLNSAATTVLSLDGTGTTNLIIPNGNNRMWNVQIDTIAVVTTITGTATGVTVGDAYRETKQLLFKRVGGTSSIVGTVDTTAVKNDTSMSTASLVVTAGASQEMALTFAAPTFSGGGSVTCRVVARIQLVEVAY